MKKIEFDLDSYKNQLVSDIIKDSVLNINAEIPQELKDIIKEIQLIAATHIAVLLEQSTKKTINEIYNDFKKRYKSKLLKLKKEYYSYYNLNDTEHVFYICPLEEFFSFLEKKKLEKHIFDESKNIGNVEDELLEKICNEMFLSYLSNISTLSVTKNNEEIRNMLENAKGFLIIIKKIKDGELSPDILNLINDKSNEEKRLLKLIG